MRVVGNAKRAQIEIRYQGDDRYLDEVVAEEAHVHLEQMSDSAFALIIETKRERACIMLGAKRAHVNAWECWSEKKKRAAR